MSTEGAASEQYARARSAVAISLGIILLLLATHLGEFWPFSINPMFSRAGRPFTRSVVRELGPDEAYALGPSSAEELPGRPLALVPIGVAQNDIADFVSKTKEWTPAQLEAMQHLFAEHTPSHRLLVLAAHGELSAGQPRVSYRPLVELGRAGPRYVGR